MWACGAGGGAGGIPELVTQIVRHPYEKDPQRDPNLSSLFVSRDSQTGPVL